MESHEVPLAELEYPASPGTPFSLGERQFRWLASGVTVLALAVVVAPGGADGRESAGGRPTGPARELRDDGLSVLGNGEFRLVPMVAPKAPVAVRLGWNPGGTGFVDGSALPELPPPRTYQLWALVGTDRVSVGVLGRRPGVVPFSAQIPELRGFSLTEEPARGSGFSLSTPLAYAGIAFPFR